MTTAEDANRRWGEMLAEWAIPPELVTSTPASPYFFDPAVFIAAADDALARVDDTVSDRVAREALGDGGSVLDVGVGAGAASLRLDPSHVTGVDPSRELLDAFAERAAGRGLAHTEVQGTWPDVAAQTATADVVVCHHLVYNVADLAGFATQLASHARQRVVIELTAVHPVAWLAPYWEALHDIAQPQHPTATDVVAMLTELGLSVHQQTWSRKVQMIGELGQDQVNRIARRLCLGPERVAELRQLLTTTPPPATRDVLTIWW